MRRVCLLATLGLVLSGTACGQDDGPREAVVTFYRALGDQDAERACDQLASDGRALQGSDRELCIAGLRASFTAAVDPDDTRSLRSVSVTGAEIAGDRATVRRDQIVGAPEAYRNDLTLVRVDGRWYIVSGG